MLKIGLDNSLLWAILACFPVFLGLWGLKLRCRGCVEFPNALNLPDFVQLWPSFSRPVAAIRRPHCGRWLPIFQLIS